MLARLLTAFRQPGIRRALSVLCAVAFLTLTFTHASHYCGSAEAAHPHIELAAADGSSDGPDKSPGPEHCCNCSTVAMTITETTLPAAAPAERLAHAVWRAPHPHAPAADFRPPIA